MLAPCEKAAENLLEETMGKTNTWHQQVLRIQYWNELLSISQSKIITNENDQWFNYNVCIKPKI